MPHWLQESIAGLGLLLAMASVLFLTFSDPENPANQTAQRDSGGVMIASASASTFAGQ